MERVERTFTLERQTKNTYRYQEDEDGQPPVIGNIYIQKWAAGTSPPKQVRVIVEPVD